VATIGPLKEATRMPCAAPRAPSSSRYSCIPGCANRRCGASAWG